MSDSKTDWENYNLFVYMNLCQMSAFLYSYVYREGTVSHKIPLPASFGLSRSLVTWSRRLLNDTPNKEMAK